ncbi:MAG: FHA domain-containing protein [Polyangiaceae bacterium]
MVGSAEIVSGFDDQPTVHRPRMTRPVSGRVGFVLRVTGGPDAGAVLDIPPSHPSRLLVGQSASADLPLRDREVSRRHLGLDVAEGRLRLSDLGSKNGTRVNGVTVLEALLDGGERIDIGADAERAAPSTRRARRSRMRLRSGGSSGRARRCGGSIRCARSSPPPASPS